jgi:hypothetical protein
VAKIVSKSDDYKWHMDKTFLGWMYYDRQYSMKDIGDLLGISWATVQQQMNKHGMKRRSRNGIMTERTRKKLSDAREGKSPWNSGLSGNYEKWTKAGKDAARYNGGTKKCDRGYVKILKHDHPFKDSSGYVHEHRLVCEKYLNRYLTTEEVVHHRDENTSNNDIDNLFVFPNNSTHARFHRHKWFRDEKITEEKFMEDVYYEQRN